MRIIGLASLLFLSSLAIGQTINPDQIRPATSDNQVLTTVTANTPPVWAAGGGSGCSTDCVITDPSTSNRPPDGDQTIVQPSGSMFTLQDSALNGQTFTPTGASGCGIDSLIGCPEFYTQLSQDGSFGAGHYNSNFDFQFFGEDIQTFDTEDGYQIDYAFEGDTFTVSGGEFDGHAGGALNYDPQDGIQFVSMPGFQVFTLAGFPNVVDADQTGYAILPYIEYGEAYNLVGGSVMAWATEANTAVNNVSGGTITLPPLSSAPNVSTADGVYQFFFNQTTSSATTLTAAAGDTINYGSTFSLSTQGQAVELIGDSFAGNWAVVGAATGSGGGGSVGTAGQLQMVGSTAGSFAASAATDNGSVFTITEPASINSAGASQWGFTYNATPIVPGSSTTAVVGGDSSGRLVRSNAGNAAVILSGIASPGTAGDCPEFAANGYDLADTGSACGSGSGGFPITLGSTSIAASSTTTSVAGLSVNGVTLNAAGSSTLFLNQAGGYTAPSGTALTIQTNTTNNTLQTTLNMETSTANSVGLTVTPSNPSGGIEKFEVTGSSYTGNAATATNAAGLTGCSPSTAGSVCYWNGSAWTLLAGNASGTNWLQETSSGVPSWTTPGGAGTVTSVAQTVPSGFAVSGTPITSSGTLGITYSVAAAGEMIDSSAANTAGFTATPTLGASGTLGSLGFGNATSGIVTLEPVTGALGTVTASLPANTGIIAELNLAQTFSALQTYSAGINLSGTTSPLEVAGSAGTSGNCFISGGAGVTPSWSSCGSASLVFPITVSGTTTSGGIPYFSATTTLTSSGILNTGFLVKGGGAGGAPTNSLCDEGHTTANVLTCTDTGGLALTGTAQTMLSLSSNSTAGTQLTIFNSTTNAHNFSLLATGSGQGVGYFWIYDDTQNTENTAFHCGAGAVCYTIMQSNGTYGWDASGLTSIPDTGLSRDSAGVVDIGTGTQGSKAGSVNALSYNGVFLGKSQLTSPYTNATATPSTIWSFAVAASTNYQITCTGIYKSASGGAFELTATGPASPTNVSYSFRPTVALASAAPTDLVYAATGTSYPSGINATAITTAATDMPFIIEFNLNNGTTAGTLAIQGNTISTDTLTVETGSTCTIN